MEAKLFKLEWSAGECEWLIASTEVEALEYYRNTTGLSGEEMAEATICEEIGDALDNKVLVDGTDSFTLREAFNEYVKEGLYIPGVLAANYE